ncbi:MAG: hypothetical protein EAZ90_15725 [Oscillatoriales cyanobacterium]|nr:MAG: hypothetical protein EAZ90_15725 [Oscillatoriales cyanobacterium]
MKQTLIDADNFPIIGEFDNLICPTRDADNFQIIGEFDNLICPTSVFGIIALLQTISIHVCNVPTKRFRDFWTLPD